MDTKYIVALVVVILLICLMLYSKKQEHLEQPKPKLVLFSVDWCSHCIEFESTWKKLQSNPEIQKMCDTVKMDPAEFGITTFPTIRLYKNDPSQNPDNFILYSGNRSIGSILIFLKKNLNNSK